MIPNNIKKSHITKAIEEIKDNGVPRNRQSTKFSLVYEGEGYPPKYVVSIANKYANDQELKASEFSGGDETNDFLYKLGFKIINKQSKKVYSWTIESPYVFIKEMDKSTFKYNGTGIPKDIRSYFDIEDMDQGEKRNININYKGTKYSGYFEADKLDSFRTRLFWEQEFAEILRERFPDWYSNYDSKLEEVDKLLKMRFEKNIKKPQHYKVNFIDNQITDLETEPNTLKEEFKKKEGKTKYYSSKKYERDPANRRRVIEIHGTECIICSFDFEKHYGKRGEGYIEIHHIKPLSAVKGEVEVNPKTDLVPVCSNCHRMIHRRKNEVLSIAEMKRIYNP